MRYGQKVVSEAKECWDKAEGHFHLSALQNDVADFNKQNSIFKKGIAVMPICFGISFTNTLMNQARSLVHVYTDGSVVISTGAIEMGQGVNTKMLQVAAQTFGISADKIKINSTNTYRIANTSPSAASATADLNGKATQLACIEILDRIKTVAAQDLNSSPEKITIQDGVVY